MVWGWRVIHFCSRDHLWGLIEGQGYLGYVGYCIQSEEVLCRQQKITFRVWCWWLGLFEDITYEGGDAVWQEGQVDLRYVIWDPTTFGWSGLWVGIACWARFFSSSLSCILNKEVPRWSNIDSTCRKCRGLWRLVLWGGTCSDFRQIGQAVEEQEGCQSEGITEELSWYFRSMRLDFLLLSQLHLVALYHSLGTS